MKKLIIFISLIVLAKELRAQTWSEWFAQKKTQKKYLLEQIAALEVFAKDVKKGYQIVSSGLNVIHNIKHGEFSLHKTYFTSLKKVNPNVKNMAMVVDIITTDLTIKKAFKAFISHNELSAAEKNYIADVYKHLDKDCLNDLDELQNVITDDSLQMSDDQRIGKIANIHKAMQDKAAFSQAFLNQAKVLSLQKTKEQTEVKTIQQLYDIN